MFQLESVSFIYGVCFGVIPTVIVMCVAIFVDEILNNK